MTQTFRIFGNRVLVELLYPKPEHTENVNAPQSPQTYMPAQLQQQLAMAFPAVRSQWSSPFGKGQVVAIGEPVNTATGGGVVEEFSDTDVLDTERTGRPVSGSFPEDLGRYLGEFFKMVNTVRESPLPPLAKGNVILFQLHTASAVPQSNELYIVEGAGIVGVVTESDFTREGSE